ncbi:MAG TPA: RNA helicase, partial [Caulobacteraceae bacterium]|nr:RNA helicase [Caulobacteraceae bacterium]
ADDYVHRIGRTGRAGKSGDTFMIVTPADSRSLDKVLKLIGQAPDEVTLDIDWSQVKESRPREKGRGGRGPARDYAPRERRPVSEHAAMTPAVATPAAMPAAEPTAQTAPAPTAVAEPARRSERPRSRPRNNKPDAAVKTEAGPKPAPKPDRPARHERREDRDDRDSDNVRGFGADTPAFLLRSPRGD